MVSFIKIAVGGGERIMESDASVSKQIWIAEGLYNL